MPRKILVGYDGSEESISALELSLELFEQDVESKIAEFHLAYIVEEPPGVADPVPDELLESLKREGEEILSDGAKRVRDQLGSPLMHLDFGSPPQRLGKLASEILPDIVVLGIANHSQSEKIMGTVSSYFLNSKKYPLLLVP